MFCWEKSDDVEPVLLMRLGSFFNVDGDDDIAERAVSPPFPNRVVQSPISGTQVLGVCLGHAKERGLNCYIVTCCVVHFGFKYFPCDKKMPLGCLLLLIIVTLSMYTTGRSVQCTGRQ